MLTKKKRGRKSRIKKNGGWVAAPEVPALRELTTGTAGEKSIEGAGKEETVKSNESAPMEQLKVRRSATVPVFGLCP